MITNPSKVKNKIVFSTIYKYLINKPEKPAITNTVPAPVKNYFFKLRNFFGNFLIFIVVIST